jgi:hypothetical protein
MTKLHYLSIETASSSIRQQELNIIQKMTDLSLKVLVPFSCSQKSFNGICHIVLNITISNRQSLQQKKKQIKNKHSPILCHLYNGKKIELHWFFLLRAIQKISSENGSCF